MEVTAREQVRSLALADDRVCGVPDRDFVGQIQAQRYLAQYGDSLVVPTLTFAAQPIILSVDLRVYSVLCLPSSAGIFTRCF